MNDKNQFHIKITMGSWLFGNAKAPFEIVNGKGKKSNISLDQFSIVQYAKLDAYPDDIEELETKAQHNVRATVRQDANYNSTGSAPPTPAFQPPNITDDYNPNHAITTLPTTIGSTQTTSHYALIDTQLSHIAIPRFAILSHIQFLFSLFYFSMAMKTTDKDAAPAWGVVLSISWLLYRAVDAGRFVMGLIISPVASTLVLTFRSALAAGKLVLTWGHYGLASAVNHVVNFYRALLDPKEDDTLKHEATGKEVPPEFKNYTLGAPEDPKKPAMKLPCLVDTWTTFLNSLKASWKASVLYINPILKKANVVLDAVDNKFQDQPARNIIRMGMIFLMLCAWVGFDLIALEFFSRAIENRPLGTNFLDYVGGGYAKIVGHALTVAWETVPAGATLSANAIAHALAPSWDKIQIGMEFFAYFMVKNAVIAAGVAALVITMGTILYKASRGNGVDDRPIYITGPDKEWKAPAASENSHSETASSVMSYSWLPNCLANYFGKTIQQQGIKKTQ